MTSITLDELRRRVLEELARRNLKNPRIRGNALDKICAYIRADCRTYILSGDRLCLPADKQVLKRRYESYKGYALSAAESSVINEMYNQFGTVVSIE